MRKKAYKEVRAKNKEDKGKKTMEKGKKPIQ